MSIWKGAAEFGKLVQLCLCAALAHLVTKVMLKTGNLDLHLRYFKNLIFVPRSFQTFESSMNKIGNEERAAGSFAYVFNHYAELPITIN